MNGKDRIKRIFDAGVVIAVTMAFILPSSIVSADSPNTPTNPHPSNGAAYVDPHDVVLSWDGGPAGVLYDVYFCDYAHWPPSCIMLNIDEDSFPVGTLSHSTQYYWKIKAHNNEGETEGPIWAFETWYPPGYPYNFNAYNPTSNSIALSWIKGDLSDKTMIRRRTDTYPSSPDNGHQVYFGSGTSVIDDNLDSGQIHYYCAWAYSSETELYSESPDSDSEYTKPGDPSNLNAYNPTSNSIDLSWTKGSGGDKTRIQRQIGGYPSSYDDGTQVYFGTGTSITDSNLEPLTTYYYRAWAFDSDSGYYSIGYGQDYESTTDVNPPETYIDSGPSGPINYNDVTFTWHGEDDVTPTEDLNYLFMLEGYDGSWQDLTPATSETYNDLLDREYTFKVKAVDGGDNPDPTPAMRPFTVDTQPPGTPVISSPSHPSETSWYSNNIVEFQWEPVGGPSPVTYYYKFTYEGSWHDTSETSVIYENVPDGIRFFQLKATDTGGTSGTDSYTVKIDVTPPSNFVISSSTHPNQDQWYSNNDVTFTWTLASGGYSGLCGYSYELSRSSETVPDDDIDIDPQDPRTVSYSNLAEGIWYFHVKAIDGAGNYRVVQYTVQIDTVAPTTSPPMDDPYLDIPIEIILDADDAPCDYGCSGVSYTMINVSKWTFHRLEVAVIKVDHATMPINPPPRPPPVGWWGWEVVIPWQEYDGQIIEETGQYMMQYYSVDNAGNVEGISAPFFFTVGPNENDD